MQSAIIPGLMGVAFNRRSLLLGVFSLATLVHGCSKQSARLRDVLAPARGQIEDGIGAAVDVDAVLASARNRPVTLSFGYVGCGGRIPKIKRIMAAVGAAAQDHALHLIFDAVDGPNRYADVVQDVTGDSGGVPDVDAPLILFIKKDDLWVQQSNRTVRSMLDALHVPFGKDAFVQTVSEIALFGHDGTLLGIHY